jgi:hypothetical protein
MLSAHSSGGGNGFVVGGAFHDFRLNNTIVASKEK